MTGLVAPAADDARRASRGRALVPWLAAGALVWHLAALYGTWEVGLEAGPSSDFIAYYYAVQTAEAGGDPYARDEIARAARRDGAPRGAHPFLYPPPFLSLMAWMGRTDLHTAFGIWFVTLELALACGLFALWRWWKPLGAPLAVLLLVAAAAGSHLLHNHRLGQSNLIVFALTVAGLERVGARRENLGGALVGLAAAIKLMPLAFVGGWLLEGRRRAPAAALATALVAAAVSAVHLGPAHLTQFLTGVLPDLVTGRYGGLTVAVDSFANHAPASLLHALVGITPTVDPTAATWATGLTVAWGLLVLGGVAWVCARSRASDPSVRAACTSLLALSMLLVPVFTFDHYLVWALPAVVLTCHAVICGRLAPRWLAPLVPAWALWAIDVRTLRVMATRMGEPAVDVLAQGKLASLLVLAAACAVLALRGGSPVPRDRANEREPRPREAAP